MRDRPELYVAGTGSFALEIAEYAHDAGFVVRGLIELVDRDRVGSTIHDLAVVGIEQSASARAAIGIGGDRVGHWSLLAENGWQAATIVHPTAHVSGSAVLREGAIVGPNVVVGAASALGPQSLVGRGALVGHHVRIEAGAVLNPGANIGGNAAIGASAQVGMGAIVRNAVVVGERAVVAAGAVVLGPVEAETRVQGVPARVYSPT